MSKTKIFVVGPIPPPIHGESMAMKQILESEMADDFELIVINKASLFSRVGDQGKFHIIKLIRDISLFIKLVWNLIWKSPTICYISMAQSRSGMIRDSFIINICSKFSSVIVHLHCGAFRTQFDQLNFLGKLFVRGSLKRVVKVIVLSERFKSMFTNLVPSSKICVVQNGLSKVDIYKEHSNLEITKTGIKILFLSNLQPEKGLWDLLNLLGRVKIHKIPFTAVVAGPFPDNKVKNRALQLISELNLENNIELPGMVTGQAKNLLFANADVFVFLPNQIEGQPLVIIEALRAGLPILTTPQEGIADMVIDGENGFVVPVHDIEAMFNNLNILINNAGLRIAMGKKSRRIFLNEYTEEIHIRNINSVIGDVLKMRTPN